MREEAKWWIDDAHRSLSIADENFRIAFYEVTVFYCQQSLEKLLKGSIIAFKKTRPKKTHKLIDLYQTIERTVPLDEELTDFLHTISPYYFTARYPDVAMGLPAGVITKRLAKESLEKTKRIFECFDKKLSGEQSKTT
jgi:HEPN domain-containing protein